MLFADIKYGAGGGGGDSKVLFAGLTLKTDKWKAECVPIIRPLYNVATIKALHALIGNRYYVLQSHLGYGL